MSPIGVGARWMLAAGILIPLAACSQEQQKASAKTAAEEIWKEYAAGLNSGDIDRWLALWTADGVQMPPDEPPVVGKENIRVRNEAGLEKFSEMGPGRSTGTSSTRMCRPSRASS